MLSLCAKARPLQVTRHEQRAAVVDKPWGCCLGSLAWQRCKAEATLCTLAKSKLVFQ